MRLQDIILSHTLLPQTSSPSGSTNFTDFRRTRCRVRIICNAECSCAPKIRLSFSNLRRIFNNHKKTSGFHQTGHATRKKSSSLPFPIG